MNRSEIINRLIKKVNGKRYLEIGIFEGHNFNSIICEYKVGIDPDKSAKCTHNITSDEFFEINKEKFDVIFIDGLHHADQVEKDILNALSCLSENGYIVCHDMNPTTEIMQLVPRQSGEWTGDCWKAWVKLRQTRSDLYMYVIDTDYGCGIIKQGTQELLINNQKLNYANFEQNKQNWLNLISINNFIALEGF
jgi:2-polyprenyl-3-methyl-5-hydroxy-6-metoxy-1,4-benzoquinol methylase